MRTTDYCCILLYNRGDITGRSLVDAADLTQLGAYRWYLDSSGRAARATREGPVLMHRQILGLVKGDGLEVDHINRFPLDNRRSNLRIVTHAQNAQNCGARPGARSRHRGVDWSAHGGRWRARATVGNQYFHLGYFDDEDEAGRVAAEFRAAHMPFAT